MFMLDWVPEPVCQTTRGNSSSNLPCTTSAAAVEMASASVRSSLPRSLFTRAAACLTIASACTSGGRHPLAADPEILDGALGLRAPKPVGGNLDGAEGICFSAS